MFFRLLIILAGSCVSIICLLYGPWTENGTARSADRRLYAAEEAYRRGSFKEITNSLEGYVQFIQSSREKLSGVRHVDMLLSSAYMQLAKTALYQGAEDVACNYLIRAFEHHKTQRAISGIDPVPRDEFVEFVLEGLAVIDAKKQITWQGGSPEPTTIARVKARFEAHDLK